MAATPVGPAALNFASSQLGSDNGESNCIPASGNPAERTGRNVWYPSTGLADTSSRAPLTAPTVIARGSSYFDFQTFVPTHETDV